MKYITLLVLLAVASTAASIPSAAVDCGNGVITGSSFVVCDPGDHNLTEAAVYASLLGANVSAFSAQTSLTQASGIANLEASFLLTIAVPGAGGFYCPFFQLEGDQRSGGHEGARFDAPGGSVHLDRSLDSDPSDNCHSSADFLPFQSGVAQNVSLMLNATAAERGASDGYAFAAFHIRVYDANGQPTDNFEILTDGLAIPEPAPCILVLTGLAAMKLAAHGRVRGV